MFKIRITKYFSWLIINFVFGLLPFWVHVFYDFSIEADAVNNFLTFGFTLLVSSIYLFNNYSKNIPSSGLSILLGILICVIYLLIYISYYFKSPEWFFNLILNNYSFFFISLSFTLVVTSFSLNFKAIEAEVEQSYNELKIKSSSEYSELLQQVKSKIS